MVALKHVGSSSRASKGDSKQERRGGIETAENVRDFLTGNKEAGTPWWH